MSYIGASSQGVIGVARVSENVVNLDGGSVTNATIASSNTFPSGHIIQIKGVHDNTQDAVSVGNSIVAIGNLKVTITPVSLSNTIIIHGCIYIGGGNADGGFGIGRHPSSSAITSGYTAIGAAQGQNGTYIRADNFYSADAFDGDTSTISAYPFTFYDNSLIYMGSISEQTYTVFAESGITSGTTTYYYNQPALGTSRGKTNSYIFAYEVVGSVT